MIGELITVVRFGKTILPGEDKIVDTSKIIVAAKHLIVNAYFYIVLYVTKITVLAIILQ